VASGQCEATGYCPERYEGTRGVVHRHKIHFGSKALKAGPHRQMAFGPAVDDLDRFALGRGDREVRDPFRDLGTGHHCDGVHFRATGQSVHRVPEHRASRKGDEELVESHAPRGTGSNEQSVHPE
jgi:hypothetical protein